MINFSNASFIKSAPLASERPSTGLSEVLIVGKSNVGKSSLINALTNKNHLAYTSSKPGHTRLLNFYDIDHRFYLVDAPGYGYASGGINLDRIFGEMMEDYFQNCSTLKLVLILLDSRRELGQNDVEIINYLIDKNIPFVPVITKMDKINQSEKAQLIKHLEEMGIDCEAVFTSINKPRSLTALKGVIEKAL